MRKEMLTLLSFIIWSNVSGQKTEYRAVLSSGLFSFRGASSSAVSFINYADNSNSAYTNNPYGSQNGICYGVAGNLKRVSKKNLVFGIELGYENLRSKISIDRINGYNGTSTYQYEANGKTIVDFSFINFQPFAGYRILSKTFTIVIASADNLRQIVVV